jgi:hypothetical protein
MGIMDSIMDAGKNLFASNANMADLMSKIPGGMSALSGAGGLETLVTGAKTVLSGMQEGNKMELSQVFTGALNALGKSSPEGTTGTPTDMIINAIKTFVTNDPNFIKNMFGALVPEASTASTASEATPAGNSMNIVSTLTKSPIALDFFKNAFMSIVK